MNIIIGETAITLAHVKAALAGPIRVELSPGARGLIRRSAETVLRLLKTGNAIYGVNTGFGKLAKTRIVQADLSKLQINIVRSHAAGVGQPLDAGVVRLVMLLKINALSQGASGISLAAMDALVGLLNADVLPLIPGQGSVGASGDLAPLAHLSLVLIGEGRVALKGAPASGLQGLQAAGLNGTRSFRAGCCRTQWGSSPTGRRTFHGCGHGIGYALRSPHSLLTPASRPSSGCQSFQALAQG